jgi:hypothetical protein
MTMKIMFVWVNPESFKYLKKEIKKGEIEKEDITKDNIQIGDVVVCYKDRS